MKTKFNLLVVLLFFHFILSSQCNNNFIANGSFEIGNPTSNDEDIDNAQSWSGIWICPGGGGCSTGEFYNVNTTSIPGVLTPPVPASQQNFGGFWINIMDNPHYREGIMNQMNNPIPATSGIYNLCLKIACLYDGSGMPVLSIYGVPTGAVSTGPPGAVNPLNDDLFSPKAILLGQIPFTTGSCDNNFQIHQLTFNSDNFPAGISIDRVFFTRGDGVSGGFYIAVDDICISQSAAQSPPMISCPDDVVINCDPNVCYAMYTLTPPEVETSFCSSTSLICMRNDGLDLTDPFPKGTTTITCIADNGFGTDTCSYQITVNDTEPPEANCNSSIVVNLPADGTALIVSLNEIDNGSIDNCAIATMTLDLDTFDCSYAFQTQVVTLIVEDNSGNISECETSIFIESELHVLGLDLTICEGDTFFVNETPYYQPGIYQQTIVNDEACDSFININLNVVPCLLSSSFNSTPVICNGDASGIIEFSIENGNPPFSYNWQNLNGGYNGSGVINSVGEWFLIENIPAGTYAIHIEDQDGNNDVFIIEIAGYPTTEVLFSASDYNGFNVSCTNGSDGFLDALIWEGVTDETYLWNTGQTTNPINQLQEGIYSVTVVDQFGCTAEGSYELVAPPALELSTSHIDPFCDDLESGVITIIQTNGGIPEYSYSLDGGDFTTDLVFEGLQAGSYIVQVIDANECIAETNEFLLNPQIPQVELGQDYGISLGDLINLNPSINNITIQEIYWESIEILDCYNCLEPSVIPLQSNYYTVTVTSEDGCIGTDSIFIEVDKPRNIYAPNTFSPDFNGTNDFFTLYGGLDVAMIRKLSIFNRWGAVVFETYNIEAGKEALGWDGAFKGKALNPDAFVWMAEVEFIDGEVQALSGSVTLKK